MKKIINWSFVFLLGVLCCFSFVSAADVNLSVKDNATLCINNSVAIVAELQAANFSIARANDTLIQAENLYLSQVLVEQRSRTAQFDLVFPYCDTIANLKVNAYNSRDAFIALSRFYNESFVNTNINTSSVGAIMSQISDEIKSERYEKVQGLVTQAYTEIINVKSESSTLNLFYQSTTRSLQKFFLDNWKTIILSLTVLIVLFFVYRASIYRMLIRKKITNLQARKESLKNLIMKTQKQYFEGGNISESSYTIRTKSFAEMIRDIDRQIPLLQERLFLYSGGRSKEETKYAKIDEKHQKKEKKKFEKHVQKHEKLITKKISKEHKLAWEGFKPRHKKFKKAVKQTDK